MHSYYGGWGWAGWLTMTVIGVAFWAAVIWLVATLVRGEGRDRVTPRQTPPRTPTEVLADRFATGEISEEEYRSCISVLQKVKEGVS